MDFAQLACGTGCPVPAPASLIMTRPHMAEHTCQPQPQPQPSPLARFLLSYPTKPSLCRRRQRNSDEVIKKHMEVPDDLVEEFLLRLPPADPASLVRAALVCKPWCRLISTPRFRRRFREFHRTPPMLGFLANTTKGPRFVSTSSFRPPALAGGECRGWLVLDARHGRVLLRSTGTDHGSPTPTSPRLVVWCPVTDEWRYLPLLSLRDGGWNAAVLCAASGSTCDHLDCQGGEAFLVVVVATVAEQSTLSIYSSKSRAWSKPRPLPTSCPLIKAAPAALVGTTLYFLGTRVLGYDVATGETFAFSTPRDRVAYGPMLITTEDGGLGIALGEGVTWARVTSGEGLRARVSLWSMQTGPDGDIGWAQNRIIELDKLLHAKASIYPAPVGFFAPGLFFFDTADGLFSIDLISDQVKKELVYDEIYVTQVVPYMSFYTPAPGLTINYR